ncbi:MAG TPA: SDR family NAD(P)-dependent oxidoreductase [Solirubrobacteraceae bacterium]
MSDRVLVTGGAGFIGSHVVELLLEQGYEVVVYDALVDQVHRGAGPVYVPDGAQFIHGDVRDRDSLCAALQGIEAVVHLAAEVGVGQSMYEISRYVDANTSGTGVLLDLIANQKTEVRRIVVASSMSIYGEGTYRCATHGVTHPPLRSGAQLASRDWELHCPECGEVLTPTGTAETKPPRPTSVYAISKMDQELLCLAVGGAYDLGVVALRYFNTYGPRQALSNPYTGVAAIFSSRLLNGRAPLAFEDGQQLRDFIHVRDTARATVLALESSAADGQAINVGADSPMTVVEVAGALGDALGVDIAPELTGTARAGDIRHCYADMTKAGELLGFVPEVSFAAGVGELMEWVSQQHADDLVDRAQRELSSRGLAR